MYIKLKNIKIHIGLLFAAGIAYAINSGVGDRLAIVFISALLHELTHTAMLISYGVSDLSLVLSPFGASIKGEKMSVLNYRQTAVVALSAPAVNLCICLFFYFAAKLLNGELLMNISAVNLCLGLVNLLPLSFLDGGRALKAITGIRLSCEKTAAVCSACEYIGLIAVIIFSVTAVFVYNVSPLILLFSAFCLGKLIFEHKKEKNR